MSWVAGGSSGDLLGVGFYIEFVPFFGDLTSRGNGELPFRDRCGRRLEQGACVLGSGREVANAHINCSRSGN